MPKSICSHFFNYAVSENRIPIAIYSLSIWSVICAALPTASHAADFIIADGQLVAVPAATSSGTTVNGALPATAAQPKSIPNVSSVYESGLKTLSWLVDGMRAAKARDEATALAAKVASENPGKVVLVPVLADRPPRELKPGATLAEEGSKDWVRDYKVGPASIYEDQISALNAQLGASTAEIRQPGLVGYSTHSFLSYAIMGYRSSESGATARPINSKDIAEYQKRESERQEKIAKEREQEAQRKVEEAKAEEARKMAEANEEAKKRAREDRERAEKEAADLKARREALAKSNERIEKERKEMDEACSHGATNACIFANDRLTNTIEFAEKKYRTAFCMQFEPGQGPKSGPCAEGAPPCMYCGTSSQLMRQDLIDRQVGNATLVALRMHESGNFDFKNFRKALNKLDAGGNPFSGINGLENPFSTKRP